MSVNNPVPVRCSHCGSNILTQIAPGFGDKFILGTYDSKTNSVNPTVGYGLNLYVCQQCGIVTLTMSGN